MTKDAVLASGRRILQLLSPTQKLLVPVLGKRSGYEERYSKRDGCRRLGFDWITSSHDDDDDIDVLPGCAAYLHMKVLPETLQPAGDHVVVLCELTRTSRYDAKRQRIDIVDGLPPSRLDPMTALHTGQLRDEGTNLSYS